MRENVNTKAEFIESDAFPETKITSVNLSCPSCGEKVFEIRLRKEEGVGTSRCLECSREYLMLDSDDYWFDVIQNGYPPRSRCSCKAFAFNLTFNYSYRDSGDIRSVEVWTNCLSCGKSKRRMIVDIDYAPTEALITRPLIFCENPKILYKLKRLNCYMTGADAARIVGYLGDEMECDFFGRLREAGTWLEKELNCEQSKAAVLADVHSVRYQWIYALPTSVNVAPREVSTSRTENAFWKQNEVIRLGSPFNISFGHGMGLHYHIEFSDEYLHGGQVIQKSQDFQKTTQRLHEWLESQFVSWRGKNCFDNPQENVRIFGDRFRKRKSVRAS